MTITRLELEPRAEHDASGLPRGGTGKDSSVWLGVALLVVIEFTVVFSLVTAYFYFRVMATAGWPPPGFPLPELERPTFATLVLVVSTGGVLWASRAAALERLGHVRLGLAAGSLLTGTYVFLSTLDMQSLEYDWTRQVYGSLVWTLSGYQYFHGLSLFALSLAMLGFGFRGRFLGARRAPLQAVVLYWSFVALSSLVMYVTIYLSPHFA